VNKALKHRKRQSDSGRQARLAFLSLFLAFFIAWPALAQEKGETKVYRCPTGQAPALAEQFRSEFGGTAGFRIAAFEPTSQIIVSAPPAVHAQISRRLENGGAAVSASLPGPGTAPSAPAASPSPQSAVPAASAVTTQTVQRRGVALRRAKPEEIEKALANIMGNRLSPISTALPQTRQYRLDMAGDRNIDLVFDLAGANVTLEGPAAAVETCARLIQVLDGPREAAGRDVRLLPLRAANLASVRRATDAIQTATQSAPAARSSAPSLATAMLAARGQDATQLPARAVSAQGPAAENPDEAAPPGTAPTRPAGEKSPGGLVNPVQIEMLEGLDVLVLRGNPEDVEQVMAIINQVEQLSAQTEPEIKLLPLRHVDCYAVSVVAQELYNQVYATRQGTVSITPIIKPNAMLLVGRPENVRTVMDLVEKLDQPADPDAQFQVFPLRHAPAASVQATILDLFQDRGGLAAAVRATADARSNAVIVQASPRDMAEVAALIQRIDTTQSAAVNEIRIIQLRNTPATEVAAVINDAISTAAGGGQAVAQPRSQLQQQPGQPGQPGQIRQTAPSAAQSSQRSAMLQFLTVDAQGKRLLSSGILSNVQVTADARSNSIVLSAPADSLELLEALIRQLDQLPAAESTIKVFTVINGDAGTLVNTLSQLFSVQAIGAGQQGMFLQRAPQQGQQGLGSSTIPLRFAVDMRTNSIIASGSAGDLMVVETILTCLDSEVRNRKSIVIRLKNSPADQVAQAVNNYLTSERSLQQQMAGMTSAFEQIEREVGIVPEIVTNSLILSATPRFFSEIETIINKLDERPPMVMIQVLIAQIDLGCTDEFGIELGLQDSIMFDRSLLSDINYQSTTTQTASSTVSNQTIVAAENKPGFNFNNTDPLGNSGADKALAAAASVASQGLSNFSLGRSNTQLGYGGLVLSLASESVSVLLRALSENKRVEVLQRPQIMTLDNQQAFIQVGQTVPTITGVNINTAGTINTITKENVGLIVIVQPRITPDGLVVMSIAAEKSELGAEADGIPITAINNQVIRSPLIKRTIAQTGISAMDGHTVVLGGLISNDKEETHRKVPMLGDIPLLGHLFRYDSTVNSKRELLIIMTPHIVKNEADADKIRRTEAARMSWCLSDVTRIHGEAGLRQRTDAWADSEVTTIYPDGKIPSAEVPLEPIPAPPGNRPNKGK